MPFGMDHVYFPGSFGEDHPHHPNGLEATWILSMSLIGGAVTVPIVFAILKSCNYRRPTMLLILNMTLIDSVICLAYMPFYVMFVLLNPVVQPTMWFCVHVQALFRAAQASKLSSFCLFSIKLFYNIQRGRTNERSLKSSLHMSFWIFSTWFVYFIIYHPSLLSSSIGIISDLETDNVCRNLTSAYIPGKGNTGSAAIAGIVNLTQIIQVVITSVMFCGIFFSISQTSLQKFQDNPLYNNEMQKSTYLKAGRSTAILLIVFLISWIPTLIVDWLLVMDYNVHRAAIHFAINITFMSPILIWITMLFAIKSLRIDLGKCCSWICCYKPPVVTDVRIDGESKSESWMQSSESTDSGRI